MELSIIERVKQVREDNKMSQKEFSEALGVSLGYVGGVETGRNPINHTFLTSLKEKFNISADWLLFGIEPQNEIDNVLQLALALDDAHRHILVSAGSIYTWLKESTKPNDIKTMEALEKADFMKEYDKIWEIDNEKSKLYVSILKDIVTEKKPISEIPDKISKFADINLKIHKAVFELFESSSYNLHQNVTKNEK